MMPTSKGTFALAAVLAAATVPAQAAEQTVSLKGGESSDAGTTYAVVNCRSILKGDPSLDVLEAPSGVTATLRKEKVVPRSPKCTQPVPGATVVVSAPKDVKARSEGRLTLRISYDTLGGKRQSTREYNVILFP